MDGFAVIVGLEKNNMGAYWTLVRVIIIQTICLNIGKINEESLGPYCRLLQREISMRGSGIGQNSFKIPLVGVGLKKQSCTHLCSGKQNSEL